MEQIPEEALAYLLRRGYTREMVKEEKLSFLPVGRFDFGQIGGYVDHPSILFPIESLSGKVTGYHTASITERDYRTFDDLEHHYLPVFYGSSADIDILWKTGQVLMTEGVFDRAPIKRAFPERAVFSRLTKGMSAPLHRYMGRMAHRVWFAFDMDLPGEKAALKAEKRMTGLDVLQLKMPYKDPGFMYEKTGVDGVRRILGRQINQMDL